MPQQHCTVLYKLDKQIKMLRLAQVYNLKHRQFLNM
jgi:hypothetical protein